MSEDIVQSDSGDTTTWQRLPILPDYQMQLPFLPEYEIEPRRARSSRRSTKMRWWLPFLPR